MALVLADRVQEYSTTTGTGTLTLSGAYAGFQTFSAAIGNGNTCYYTITSDTNQWEVGVGTVGVGTLARTTLISSSTGSLVSFTGTLTVFVTYPAEKAVYGDGTTIVAPSGALLPVANGGTGLALVTANRIPYGNGTSALQTSANLTFDGTTLTNTGNAIISDNSANAALRITQVGAGNALLVEDSANPDASPFVVSSSGQVGIGAVNDIANYPLAVYSTIGYTGISLQVSSVDSGGPVNRYQKNRSGGIVQSGDELLRMSMRGFDGANYIEGASIISAVDGTPGVNDMPGRLTFLTTADGASASTERMRINSAGEIGIGVASTTAYSIRSAKNVTGAVTTYGIVQQGTVQSDNTTTHNAFLSNPATQATAFTLTNLRHYTASQGTIGATSAVTNQYGVFVDSTLTGATNNYGFYGNIASATGRYNFYAAGTAANVFVGITHLGGAVGSESLRVTPVASAVNYWNFQGSATAGSPSLSAQGSDTNISLYYLSKGIGSHVFTTTSGANIQLLVSNTTSAVNYLQISGGVTTAAPVIVATGSDTNIDIALTPKGTGVLKFGTYTAGILAQAGYITIKDAAGNTRNLLVG